MFCHYLHCILHSLRVVDNARKDPFLLPQIFRPKAVHLRQPRHLINSSCTFLNTFKLHPRRIWLFAAHTHTVNPLSIMNSMLSMIQLMTWTHFSTSTMMESLQTSSPNHRQLVFPRRNHTPAPVLRWAITFLRHGNVTLRVTFKHIYKTIPSTHLRHMMSKNISHVGSRRRAWRHTMTACWREKTPLSISQVSTTGMASRGQWLTCHMVRPLGCQNYTLSRIWDGMTITNTPLNSGAQTLSKAWDGWCGSQPMPSFSLMPLSVDLTAKCHRYTSIPHCTLQADGWRHRYRDILEDNNELIRV